MYMPDSESGDSRCIDIVPLVDKRDPWISSSDLRRIVSASPADPELLNDLADVRGADLDE
jgi:hypothetical protein